MVENASVKTLDNQRRVYVIFRTVYSISYVTRYEMCFGVLPGVAHRVVNVTGIGMSKCAHWKIRCDCVYFKQLLHIIQRVFNN